MLEDLRSFRIYKIAQQEVGVSILIMSSYCVIGILGNLLSAAVFLRKGMRGPYTGLVVGLAVFDTLILMNPLIFFLGPVWTNPTLYVVAMVFLSSTSVIGSRYITLAIAAERFYVVYYYPLQVANKTREHPWFSTSCWFVVGFALMVPVFIISYVWTWGKGPWFRAVDALVYMFPFPSVVILSVALVRRLKQVAAARRTMTRLERQGWSITRMMLGVTVVFGICCSLDFLYRILRTIGYLRSQNVYTLILLHSSSHFYMINSCVNFIIYGAISKRFRREARDMITNFCRQCAFGAAITNKNDELV